MSGNGFRLSTVPHFHDHQQICAVTRTLKRERHWEMFRSLPGWELIEFDNMENTCRIAAGRKWSFRIMRTPNLFLVVSWRGVRHVGKHLSAERARLASPFAPLVSRIIDARFCHSSLWEVLSRHFMLSPCVLPSLGDNTRSMLVIIQVDGSICKSSTFVPRVRLQINIQQWDLDIRSDNSD